ncbi:MAG: 2-C-methyl-D-erythritol 2,4-cyclodiphosphate synthase [Gammaproteobacteria bacterium]
MRIGHGYDAHAFITGKPLVLGGVTIPHDKGLAAHSDGDAVIHALCDALLGAAALGDIGKYFPDTDKQFKNIDSRVLLRKVADLLAKEGYRIGNTDITVLAQAPKLAPYIDGMRKNLAEDLKTAVNNISIKATTTERMGFVGREEGIAVYTVALLEQV